jgi:hypothetical protein
MKLCGGLLLWLALSLLPAHALEASGVQFDERTSLAGSDLVLNGAGTRIKMIFKVYAIALYLPQKAASSANALASKGPRRIQIVTLRELTAEQLSDALVEFMRKNQSSADLAILQPRIETLRHTMLNFGTLPEKTRVRLDYLPTSGTRIFVGDEQKGSDIPGEDFYLALMKIWLGEHVPQESLRDALLGHKS